MSASSGLAFRVVIPARSASTRLPDKPLADIAGLPMVVRVWQRACVSGAAEVLVATDDARIVAAVEAAGGMAMLTRADHPSGTDRLAEVATRHGWADDEIIVNVQGDEPLIEPGLIRDVAQTLADDGEAAVATAAHALSAAADFFNPNVVKVVCDRSGRALYFSRAPLPWARDAFAAQRDRLPAGLPALRHVGLYAYRAGFLQRYADLAPTALEQFEALEQLRVLWHGDRIVVRQLAAAPPAGVDTVEDLERVRAWFAAGHDQIR